MTEDEDQKEDDGRERRQEDRISTRRPNWLYCVLGSYQKVNEVSVSLSARRNFLRIFHFGRRGSEVGRLGCEPWLRARRAGMKTRILSAHISFSINMTGIIRRAYVVWDNQTSIQSAAVLDHVLDSECRTARKQLKHAPCSPSVQNCLVFHMRQLQLTARRQPATRRVHGRPRHYTRMDSQTHIEIMREP